MDFVLPAFCAYVPGMTTLNYTIDVWADDACTAIEETLAAAGDIKVARAAYNAAVQLRPGRMITLRNRAMVLAQSREPPPDPDAKVVPIRRIIGPIFADTDDDAGR